MHETNYCLLCSNFARQKKHIPLETFLLFNVFLIGNAPTITLQMNTLACSINQEHQMALSLFSSIITSALSVTTFRELSSTMVAKEDNKTP